MAYLFKHSFLTVWLPVGHQEIDLFCLVSNGNGYNKPLIETLMRLHWSPPLNECLKQE